MAQSIKRTRSRVREVAEHVANEEVTVLASGVGVDEVKREAIRVRKFVTEPAYVRVGAGVTRNMGNYESLRIDVSLTIPCYTEEVSDVRERIGELVSEMLDDEVNAYLDNMGADSK